MKVVFIFVLLTVTFCLGRKLPSVIKKCRPKAADYDECMRVAVETFYGLMKNAIPEVGFPILDPIQVPALTIPASTRAVAVEQKFTDIQVYGFSNANISEAHFDHAKKTYFAKGFWPKVKLVANYELKGQILVLPVEGRGPCSITLTNVTVSCPTVLEEYTKKGVKHFKVVDWKLTLEPELVTFHFENLFNGDKVLGDNINKVVNENWKDVYFEAKEAYEQAFASIHLGVVNRLFARIPAAELFEEE